MTNGRFGTFGGVFTPCVLTILGVIMFLRFGQVVGQAGVWQALLIVLMSKVITTLTSLSLSAISTNTRVKGGGAYYLISRSLGVEFGGSIGVVFFLAQALSVSLYVIGFTEALLATFPELGLSLRAVATLVNIAVFVCVFIGAGWAIKVQYVILGALVLSLLSFFGGAVSSFDAGRLRENLQPGYVEGASFWTMFALFFPAATGIMAGANMSGDLKDPARSIPRGTLSAVGVTAVVYLLMAVALGGATDRGALIGDGLVVRSVSWVGALITLGVFAATLSSALGSMMGAPRILQALAKDRIFARLRFFGAGDGPSDEPRRATFVSFLLAQGGILLGDLDVIAPVITMFFMITYGYLNLAKFYEAATKNPSYRPRFRYSHWATALLGAVSCGAMMVLISPLAAIGAIGATLLLHWTIARRNVLSTWGDLKSGTAFTRARRQLLRLEREEYHPKNWRPSILALSGSAWSRVHLAVYGHWLTGGSGILTLGQVIAGDSDQHLHRRRRQEAALHAFIEQAGLEAFTAVLVAPDLTVGTEALVQCHGIGAFRPNLVLLGWSTDPERAEDFAATLRAVKEIGCSVVLVNVPPEQQEDPWRPGDGTIDVWWRGKQNGPLMVLLGHMLQGNVAWRGRPVRLLRVIGAESGRAEAEEHLRTLIEEARIEAIPMVIVSDEPVNAIRRESADAAAVFVGFEPPPPGDEPQFMDRTNHLIEGFKTSIVVWSAGDVALDA